MSIFTSRKPRQENKMVRIDVMERRALMTMQSSSRKCERHREKKEACRHTDISRCSLLTRERSRYMVYVWRLSIEDP